MTTTALKEFTVSSLSVDICDDSHCEMQPLARAKLLLHFLLCRLVYFTFPFSLFPFLTCFVYVLAFLSISILPE